MNSKQLLSRLPLDFEIPSYVDEKRSVKMREAGDLPFVYWPNYVPCYEGNAYMLSLWEKGLSRQTRGGTLAEYAKNISPLLRFCFSNSIALNEMSDNRFAQFIRGLNSRDSDGGLQRSSNQVLSIGRRCIDFLIFIGELYGTSEFVGEKNCRITVVQKKIGVRRGGKKVITRKFWHHADLPAADPKRKKLPISPEVVFAIKNQARKIEDKGLRLRKELMIASFEQTGGRRIEVARILINDVEDASLSSGGAPLLRMFTAKDGSNRSVPVPRTFIDQAMRYIKRVRRAIVRRTIGSSKDHGFLFVSHTTGRPLKADTLTTEMHKLCVAAGVSDKPGHPHLFRHSYITQKFVAAIEHYELTNQDEFRKALLSTSKLKLDFAAVDRA